MLRRETIIALRARHTAFRIATDILYPHQSVGPAPEPVMPIMDMEGEIGWGRELARRRKRIVAWIILGVWVFLGVLLVVYSIETGTRQPVPQPPPVPQGRPILPAQ